MNQKSDLEQLRIKFIENRELLESGKKLSKQHVRDILLAYNDLLALYLQLFINGGAFEDPNLEDQNSMFG